MMRSLFVFVIAALCAGCWDFVEPDFPEAGAPAVLQSSTFVDERGNISIDALLAPGFTVAGLQREVPNDTLHVYGLSLAPAEIKKNGSRAYTFSGNLDSPDPLRVPFVLDGPVIEEVTGPPPHVRWFGIRKLDPDTITWPRGTELRLRIDTTLAQATPLPQIRQWFLEIRGKDRSFRVSSDGLPPATLRLPAEWVPADTNGIVTATLSFYQSGTLLSPKRDYIGNISFTVLIRWIIKVTS
jgi:hypothetical protein